MPSRKGKLEKQKPLLSAYLSESGKVVPFPLILRILEAQFGGMKLNLPFIQAMMINQYTLEVCNHHQIYYLEKYMFPVFLNNNADAYIR